jgi:hypothetical protein
MRKELTQKVVPMAGDNSRLLCVALWDFCLSIGIGLATMVSKAGQLLAVTFFRANGLPLALSRLRSPGTLLSLLTFGPRDSEIVSTR